MRRRGAGRAFPIMDSDLRLSQSRASLPFETLIIAVFPILADPVDVKKGDQLCETVSQPSIQPDKMDRPMGS